MSRYRSSRKYRKWSPSSWGDSKFLALTGFEPSGKALYLYLVLGPHVGALPCAFRASRAGLADDLGWTLEGFDEAFAELFESGMVKADWKTKVVFLPNSLPHNLPENPNVCQAWAKGWMDLPDSELTDLVLQHVTTFLKVELADRPTLYEGFRKPFAKRWDNQEQEQEQEQEQNKHHRPLDTKGSGNPTADDDESVSGRASGTGLNGNPAPEGCGSCGTFGGRIGYSANLKGPCNCPLGRWRVEYQRAHGAWPVGPERPGSGTAKTGKRTLSPEAQALVDKMVTKESDEELDQELPV